MSEGNKYLTEIQEKKLITDWNRLTNDSDKDNNTFKNKKLFKVAYDTSDIDINYSNYLNLRKPTLNQRANTIDNNNYEKRRERNYNKGNILSKSIDVIHNNNVFNKYENRVDYYKKHNDMDKGLFFGISNTILNNKN